MFIYYVNSSTDGQSCNFARADRLYQYSRYPTRLRLPHLFHENVSQLFAIIFCILRHLVMYGLSPLSATLAPPILRSCAPRPPHSHLTLQTDHATLHTPPPLTSRYLSVRLLNTGKAIRNFVGQRGRAVTH